MIYAIKKYGLLLFVAFLAASCASTQYLNDYKTAQEAFNRASAIGNQRLVNPESMLINSPEGDYRTARAFIMKAMGDSPASSKDDHSKTKLAADGLLLTAYNIRALSEWKLGMYSAALKTAKACRQSFENDPSVKQQRDYIVMEIMQALIHNDSIASYVKHINANTGQQEPSADEANYLKLLTKSMEVIKEQRRTLAADNPLQSYLCITQLSIAKNWKNMVAALSQQMKRQQSNQLATWNEEWQVQRNSLNIELKGVFADLKLLLPDRATGIYDTWKKAHVDVVGI